MGQNNFEKNQIEVTAPLTNAIVGSLLQEKRKQQNFRYYSDLMRHDTYRRVGGRVRQQRWGR